MTKKTQQGSGIVAPVSRFAGVVVGTTVVAGRRLEKHVRNMMAPEVGAPAVKPTPAAKSAAKKASTPAKKKVSTSAKNKGKATAKKKSTSATKSRKSPAAKKTAARPKPSASQKTKSSAAKKTSSPGGTSKK